MSTPRLSAWSTAVSAATGASTSSSPQQIMTRTMFHVLRALSATHPLRAAPPTRTLGSARSPLRHSFNARTQSRSKRAAALRISVAHPVHSPIHIPTYRASPALRSTTYAAPATAVPSASQASPTPSPPLTTAALITRMARRNHNPNSFLPRRSAEGPRAPPRSTAASPSAAETRCPAASACFIHIITSSSRPRPRLSPRRPLRLRIIVTLLVRLRSPLDARHPRRPRRSAGRRLRSRGRRPMCRPQWR